MIDARAMRALSRLGAVTLALAVIIAACGTTNSPAPSTAVTSPSASGAPTESPSPGATEGPSASPSDAASPSPSAAAGDSLLGTDGRFTILLLGSDYRPSAPGNRTDAIMLVSLDPKTGQVGVASLPRDTFGFPLPEGGTFNQKVNALYQWYQSRNGNGLASMKQAIGKAFGIEVDYAVLSGFAAVRQMVNAVGGVSVTLPQAYYDAEYWVTARHKGWGLPAGKSQLNGDNALIMARSRKGDNDFGRARRQQILVASALDKVKARGAAILPALVSIATGLTVTDLPLARIADLYSLVSTANSASAKRAVLGPSNFASASGPNFVPKIAAIRAWITKYFPPARPGATWPPQG